MSNKKKRLFVIVSSVLILALGAGVVALVSTSVANAQSTGFQRVGGKFSNLVHVPQFGDENRFPGKGSENDKFLAEALGISVEELQAAKEKAAAAAMEAAIQSGEITEEQASLMEARQALRGYLDPEALTATALGITEEELQAAREEGKSSRDLMDEMAISEEDFQAAIKTAYEAVIQQAVEDGVIAQEQADLIISSETNPGLGGPGGFPGMGNGASQPGGPGRPGGPCQPGQNPPDMSGQNSPGEPYNPTPEGDA
jgi:hypothetical protein